MEIARSLKKYLNFLKEVTENRLNEHFRADLNTFDLSAFPLPEGGTDDTPLAKFISKNKLKNEEIIVLLVALVPHVEPVFFDSIIQKHIPVQGEFPQFGGVRGKNHRGFLPTVETAIFILAGTDLEARISSMQYFSKEHLFSLLNVISIEDAPKNEPKNSGKVILSYEYVELFLTGSISRPSFSMDFPAEFITSELEENDLVLPEATLKQVYELETWVNNQATLMNAWKMKRWIKPGYRALFYGPPGTGKTLTALIVGKKTERDVFRIDLSMVVSKFIGETEKNLSQLFNRAKNKDWILFFDEADALFGKRTNVRDAHDKYANQEVAYLLQKIENHDGLVILASNFKSNIDEAFIRRFQSVIYFPLPAARERFLLWKNTIPANVGLKIPSDAELSSVAKKYEITGAGIVNAVQYCCLESLAENSKEITVDQIKAGIEREYKKEGKVF